MIFEKAIRRRQSPLPSMGHHEIDSLVVSGSPNLYLQPQVGDLSFIEELTYWPDRLDLLVHWQQVHMDPVKVTVQDIVGDQPLGLKDFYDPKTSNRPDIAAAAQHRAIRLSFRDGHDGLQRGQELYTKTYVVQEASQLVQRRESIDGGQWQVTAPKTGVVGKNLVPLLAYGCHAPKRSRLVDIQQTYASIGTDGKDTSVNLYTVSDLRQLGIVSPEGGASNGWYYGFIDQGANQSLISDIMNQKIQVPITIGDVTRTYVSVAYRECSESDQLIYLTIKPKEEES